jgi:hypothetical protein
MATYTTLSLNVTLREDTPDYVINFFQKGTINEKLPSFWNDLGLNEANKINLVTPSMVLVQHGAKYYVDGKPKNRYFLQILLEYDLDFMMNVYALIGTLAEFAEDTPCAGYMACETGDVTLFGYKNQVPIWANDLVLTAKTYQKEDISTLFEQYEMDFINAQTLIQAIKTTCEKDVTKTELDNYFRSEDKENFIQRLLTEKIENWQDLDDTKAVKLIEEILENVATNDAILSRNMTALEKRYQKSTGALSDLIFHKDITNVDEILAFLKKNTATYL